MAPRHAKNRQAQLASEYHELGRQLTSGKLSVVGNYTLQRTIGQGTYGRVRMATHRLTNSRVAIKQIPKEHVASLTREIHHHRRLHHPHVLQLFEVIQTESYIWMILELCAGGELYDYIVERGTLPESEAREMFGQICLGVAYIHEQGIVHRDLKLENILLDEHRHIKLSDFGFTREYQPHQLLHTKCGTLAYSAPEVLSGLRYFGPEIDVWSMGVILYVLLCGYLPFDDDNESVIQWKIVHEDVEIPSTLSPDARDLLLRILQKDGQRRISIPDILSHPWFRDSSINYSEMLSAPRPALLTGSLEKELFMNLQDLGFAVGQIRHSVTTYACDAAGAFWWLLLRKSQKNVDESQNQSLHLSQPTNSMLGLSLSPSVPLSSDMDSKMPFSKQSLHTPMYLERSHTHSQPASAATMATLAPIAVDAPMDPLTSSSVKQPFLPARLGLLDKPENVLHSPRIPRRMSSMSSRASEYTPRPFSRSSSRRLSSGSIDSLSMTSSGHLRRPASHMSSSHLRRRRDSESTVLKCHLPLSQSRTPRRHAHSRPVSLDEQSMHELQQQFRTLNHSPASTPPNNASPAVFMRSSRSVFGFNKRANSPSESKTRSKLYRQQWDDATRPRRKKPLLLSEEDDWIDEEEFWGGFGQRSSLALEVPWQRTRRGSPCPPRMQLFSMDKKTSTSENTKTIGSKIPRDFHVPLIEEDEEP